MFGSGQGPPGMDNMMLAQLLQDMQVNKYNCKLQRMFVVSSWWRTLIDALWYNAAVEYLFYRWRMIRNSVPAIRTRLGDVMPDGILLTALTICIANYWLIYTKLTSPSLLHIMHQPHSYVQYPHEHVQYIGSWNDERSTKNDERPSLSSTYENSDWKWRF